MSVRPLPDRGQEMPPTQGHVMGFVDTRDACDAITNLLKESGIAESRIFVLSGEEGAELFKRMLEGSWGEAGQMFLNEGLVELSKGHLVLAVEVADREEAARIAETAQQHGGHGFDHFGALVDTKLTG